jgi:hypothetical protein
MKTGGGDVDAQEALESLDYAAAVRKRARRDAAAMWLPLLLFGTLTLASVVVARPASEFQSYWLIAGPLGGLLIGTYAYRRGRQRGLEGPSLRYVVAAVELMLLALASAWIMALIVGPFDGTWQLRFGPAIVVAAGYLGFAWLERSIAVAGVAIALLLSIVVMAAIRPPHPWTDAMLTVLYGVALIASGLGLRTRGTRVRLRISAGIEG